MNPKIPAFPVVPNATCEVDFGIDLRTYIATQCLAAMVMRGASAYSGASDAVAYADALIKELSEK